MGRNNIPPINGKLILQKRLRLRLTQAQLGQKCGELGYEMDRTNISRIESGAVKYPSRRCLPVLADALGLKISDLLTENAGSDEPHGRAA